MAYHPVIREIGILGRDVVALDVDYYASTLAYANAEPPLHTTDCYFQIRVTEARALFELDANGEFVLDHEGNPIVVGRETVPADVEAAVVERLETFGARHERTQKRGESRRRDLTALTTWVPEYDRLDPAEKEQRDPDGLLARPALRAMKVGRSPSTPAERAP